MALAGQILFAHGLEGALRAYAKAGRGSAGWAAARDHLVDQFPGSAPNSINAVLDRARQAVGVGDRYRRAGENYVPPASAIPSAVRLERPYAQGVLNTEGQPIRPVFRHIFEVTLRQPGPNGGVLQTYQEASNFLSPLRRELFDQHAEARANQLAKLFEESPKTKRKFKKLAVEVRIVGVYEGF